MQYPLIQIVPKEANFFPIHLIHWFILLFKHFSFISKIIYYKNFIFYLFTRLVDFYSIPMLVAGCLKKHILKMCYSLFAFVGLSDAHFIHTFYEKNYV